MTFSTTLEPRTYFSTLDGALADLALPLGAVDKARAAVRDLDYEHVHIPESRAYIALEPAGSSEPIAYIFPTLVALHPRDGASSFVEIAQPESKAPATPQPERASARRGAVKATPGVASVKPCPTCFTDLPLAGTCDWCG